MIAISRLQASSCTNPLLDIFITQNSVLINPTSLEFQIFDVSTPANEASPVQVFPAILGNRQAVNLAACPGGQRISTGRFAAAWTPPDATALGLHYIKWFFKVDPAASEQTSIEQFDVIASAIGSDSNINAIQPTGLYALPSDFRCEGVTAQDASDARLVKLIKRASRMIERWTGNFFEPRAKTVYLDGNGGHSLFLMEPIIAISEVGLQPAVTGSVGETLVDPNIIKVYNRHLSQNLFMPDDRQNPMIELIHGDEILTVYSDFRVARGLLGEYRWPKGRQNIRLKGVFGFTEPDGTATGTTPDLIREACMMMVMRKLPLLSDTDGIETAQWRNRITSERTRDQSYTLGADSRGSAGGAGGNAGPFTGEWEIDNILMSFLRPTYCGAA